MDLVSLTKFDSLSALLISLFVKLSYVQQAEANTILRFRQIPFRNLESNTYRDRCMHGRKIEYV